MIVGAASANAESAARQLRRERLRVRHHLLLILGELRLHRLLQTNSLCRDDVLERTALISGKRDPVEFFRVFFAAKNEPAARTAQSLVRRRGNEIRVRNGA